MFQTWTFGRKMGSGFAMAGLALVVIGALAYRSASNLIEDEIWVNQTHHVRHAVARLQAQLVDAETGERGYIITGQPEFLEPYRTGVAAAEKVFGELRSLLTSPAQQRRLDQLRVLVDQELGLMRSAIDQRRTGFEAAAVSLAAGDSKRVMDEIRVIVAELDAEQGVLLERRQAEAESSAAVTRAVSLWGSGAALVLICLFGWVITRSLTRQIDTAVQRVQSSSNQLQAASIQQATGAREQTVAMTEISTTIHELLATSRQIADSAQQVARIAQETASTARSGGAAVDKGTEAIAAILRQVDLIVSNMLELGKKSQDAGRVLDIVSDLAEQTNILSINATIEAAGAGESGRRFAVVADEIRKLADRVGGATKEIREMVDDVRSAVNATVMTTESGAKVAEVGSRQFAEVSVAFRTIADRVATTTQAAREIELSTKQQATAVEQVNTAVISVAQQTRETEASTSQTQQTATELAGLSRDLIRIVQSQAAALNGDRRARGPEARPH
ncbi:MAG TPA: CHASE3 domain-containing protein [Kofleriaceae bacterium]|nr:CHASE3 domain-containing protein [Kofleriaceae bacterium]